ncbi:hypothetical protein B5P43_23465 [Bacillus sp. SRB_336]|nr:hypothetical protein B5P43_23465 [Bacillus sp. SRB_336]
MDVSKRMLPPLGSNTGIATGPRLDEGLQRILEAAMALTSAVQGVLSYRGEGQNVGGYVSAGPEGGQMKSACSAKVPMLDIPLIAGDEVLGNIHLAKSAGASSFDASDEMRVAGLAAVAGAAVESAGLYGQVIAREQWHEATHGMIASLMSSAPSSNPFGIIADYAAAAANASCAATLIGAERDDAFPVSLHDGSSTIQRVAGPLLAKILRDVPRSVRLDPDLLAAATLPAGPALVAGLSGGHRTFGVFVVARQPGEPEFSAVDQEMLQRFASHAALVIEYLQARQTLQMRAVHEDRRRIASNLHDLVIQHLFGVGLRLQALTSRIQPAKAAAELDSFVDQIDGTIRDIRRSIFALNQPIDDGIGLRSRILNVVTATPFSFEPRVYFDGPVDSAIPARIHHDILASLGEMLSNVIRHAKARAVDVTVLVDLTGHRVVLTVRDDGTGWAGPLTAGSGTGNLADRARRLGGTCRVSLAEGGGTEMEWSVPLQGPDASATAEDPASGG